MDNIIGKINGISLALLPPLCIYKVIPGFNIATIVTVLCLIVTFFEGKKLYVFKSETTLFIVVSIMGLCSCLFFNSTKWYSIDLFINNYFALTIDFFAIMWLSYNCSKKFFVWTSLYVASAASLICLYQWFMVLFMGSFVLNTYIPGFELTRDIETITVTRPCAFFTEPAHVCMYIAPALYASLLLNKYYFSIILILGMLFSTSTTGFLLMLLVPLLYMYNQNIKKIYLIVSIAMFFIGYLIINEFYSEIFEFTLNKINNTNVSDDQRLLGPFKYIQYFDITHMILGIGLNQLENFILAVRGSLLLEGSGNYANSILYMFYSYGFIGLLFLIKYIYNQYNKTKQCIGFLIVLLAIMATDQILFTPFFVYLISYLIFAKCINNKFQL